MSKQLQARYNEILTEIPIRLQPHIEEAEEDAIKWHHELNVLESTCEEIIKYRNKTIKELERIEKNLHEKITQYLIGSVVKVIVNNVPIQIIESNSIHVKRIGKIKKSAEIYPNAATNPNKEKTGEFGLRLMHNRNEQFVAKDLTYENAMQKALDFVASNEIL